VSPDDDEADESEKALREADEQEEPPHRDFTLMIHLSINQAEKRGGIITLSRLSPINSTG
jgi:hypothetical protein